MRTVSLQRRFGLRSVLLLYVIVPLAVMLALFGVVALNLLEDRVERRMQEDVELVARAIEPALSRALEQGREESVRRALQAAFSIDRVYGAYVYDESGAEIAIASQHAPTAEPASNRSEVSEVARGGDRLGEYGEVSGRPVYSFFVPLTDSGARIIGVLQVTRRESDFDGYVRTLRIQAAGFAFLTLGLMGGVVLYGHHRAVGTHLNRIVRDMREIGSDVRLKRTRPGGPRETAQVANALNGMLDNIVEQQDEIARQQEAQIALQQKLQRSEKLAAIGQLAAGVGHELGAPLSVIDGRAQRLGRVHSDPAVSGPLEQIRREVRRMERTVEQLLDFGRGYNVSFRRVPADQIARSAASTVERDKTRPGTRIEIGGSQPSPELRVDPFRMEQALANLLRNAVQAARHGPVRLSWFQQGGKAGFEVEDDGPGVPESVRPHLFEPFFTTRKSGQGTGLGLAIVHRIAREHGGAVEVGASDMGGARFRIVLDADPSKRNLPSTDSDTSK